MMKNWKILAAAPLIAFAMNTSFADGIKTGAPSGWQVWGPLGDKYEMGIDTAESTPEHPALVISSKDTATSETVTLMQQIDAREYEGSIIEFSMMVKAVGAEKSRVWLRHMKSADFSGIQARSIPSGKDWERIVVTSHFPKDLPATLKHFDIGISLASKGKIWVRDIKLERKPYVAMSNPVELPSFRAGLHTYPARNLNFTE